MQVINYLFGTFFDVYWPWRNETMCIEGKNIKKLCKEQTKEVYRDQKTLNNYEN